MQTSSNFVPSCPPLSSGPQVRVVKPLIGRDPDFLLEYLAHLCKFNSRIFV